VTSKPAYAFIFYFFQYHPGNRIGHAERDEISASGLPPVREKSLFVNAEFAMFVECAKWDRSFEHRHARLPVNRHVAAASLGGLGAAAAGGRRYVGGSALLVSAHIYSGTRVIPMLPSSLIEDKALLWASKLSRNTTLP
jgi:hypothetical protein